MRLTLCLALGMVSCADAEVVVCVSSGAAPGGDGSRLKPYQTPLQARDGIRTLRKTGTLKSSDAVACVAPEGDSVLRDDPLRQDRALQDAYRNTLPAREIGRTQ